MIDIDNFKSFNDTYGHGVGDQVLQSVAAVIGKCFRKTDTVARYGGEEFAVLLPHTSRQSAVESAERLRAAVRDLELLQRRLTISIGASSTVEDRSQTEADLVRRADEALFQAKREGKDRICVG